MRVAPTAARPEELEQSELLLAPDEGGTPPRLLRLARPENAERLDRLGLSLHPKRAERLGREPASHVTPGRGCDEDLAGRRLLLEPRRDVYGISDDAGLRAVADETRDDQSRVDPDS